MSKREDMDLVLLMTAVTAERELMVLPSSGLIIIRDLQRKIKLSPDPMVESFVEDALNPESFVLSCLRKLKLSKELSKLPKNDFALI